MTHLRSAVLELGLDRVRLSRIVEARQLDLQFAADRFVQDNREVISCVDFRDRFPVVNRRRTRQAEVLVVVHLPVASACPEILWAP